MDFNYLEECIELSQSEETRNKDIQKEVGLALISKLNEITKRYSRMLLTKRVEISFKFDVGEIVGEWIESRKELKMTEEEKFFVVETAVNNGRMVCLISSDILDLALGESDIVFE